MSGVAPASALTAAAASPADAPPRGFWVVSQEMGADFAMGPWLLCGFRRGLFAVGSADLGKRWRWMAIRADSTCETAQKLADGVRVR